jgi:lysozyme
VNAPQSLKSQLIRDEGVVEYAYPDSLGYLTIGVGHLVDRRKGGKLPPHIIDLLLEHDITTHTADLYDMFPWVVGLDEARKATLVNMTFQLGIRGLSEFRRAVGYMERGESTAASLAFADSRVAREQTPERWARHCAQIKSGEWQ